MADEFPSVRFLLVGRDAGAMETVRSRIAALGLERNVLPVGLRKDAARIAAAADFVVHPSHEEGFSNTVIEAMAAGKAVVATNVGGNPEAVVDGETGILVPPRDPVSLAAAIISLLREPERARSMGAAGRLRVCERFETGKMAGKMERIYEELLRRTP